MGDEAEFVQIIGPHERGIVLLDDERSPQAEFVRRALLRLSKIHLEAQFCRLRSERAHFLTQMVELEALPTIFVTNHGQVTRHLPPSIIFENCSSNSPLLAANIARLLERM